ncbi:MAG: Hpt domain-containing protein [Planctomycetota bacterium]
MSREPASAPPIYSPLENNPQMREIVVLFVRELPEHIDALRRASGPTPDPETAQRVAHQLRGVAAAYGFEELGEIAAGVEDQLVARERSGGDAEPLAGIVAPLVDYCARIRVSDASEAA